MKVREACERFYADCEARKLGTETLGKYKLLVKELKDEFGESIVGQVSVDDLRSYREKWSVASVTARKKLERLRTFFKFCQESGWVHANPAKVLKAPKGHTQPTLPLTKEDFEKLLRGCEAFPCNGIYQEGNRLEHGKRRDAAGKQRQSLREALLSVGEEPPGRAHERDQESLEAFLGNASDTIRTVLYRFI